MKGETNTNIYKEDIDRAIAVMQQGGVIVYPTDTIWGIGCDATNEEAVRKVYALKQRDDSKALITLVDSEAKIEFYVREVPEVAWQLIEVADKPLTIIYDGARNLAPNLIAADGSVALRITREPFSRELCRRFRKAIVSTSANISGAPAPKTFADISEDILSGADYVRREEDIPHGPSAIIELGAGGEVKVIR